MAVKCSSSGGSSAMKASLVLMLLFGAVVAAHANHDVYFTNDLNVVVKIKVDGVITVLQPGVTVKLFVGINIFIDVGGVVSSLCPIPAGVTKVKIVQNGHDVYLVSYVGGLVGAVLDLINNLLCTIVGVL